MMFFLLFVVFLVHHFNKPNEIVTFQFYKYGFLINDTLGQNFLEENFCIDSQFTSHSQGIVGT
jgi:hypothetical protein